MAMSSNSDANLVNIENNIILLEPNLSLHSVSNNQVCYVVYPEDLKLKPPTPSNGTKRGRPRKSSKKQVIEITEIEDESDDNETSLKVWRTRSGRMTKPPKYITEINHLKPLKLRNESDKEEPMILKENKNMIRAEIKSKGRKRNISSQYRCTTCKKAYLGRVKMSKHLQLNPTHIAPSINSVSEENNVWLDLIKRLNSMPKDFQHRILFEEFVHFLHKAREMIPSLLKPVTETDSSIVVDQLISKSLGIPEGFYTFVENTSTNISINKEQNLSHFNSQIEKVLKNNTTHSETNQNKNLISSEMSELNFLQQNKKTDYDNRSSDTSNDQSNLLLNLLDSGQVTFDSASSDDVVNMEQLINERLKTLTDGVLEHNNSQSLNLDLSLDMFSYHGN